MASKSAIVQMMMDEFGRDSSTVRERVERSVGEITVDLLSQNYSRFRRLRKMFDITVTAANVSAKKKQWRLPPGFASAGSIFLEVDSDGEFVKEIPIVDESEYYMRKADVDYAGNLYGRVETLLDASEGPGDYLLLNTHPTVPTFYKLPYYRKPTEDDTDIITNLRAIKVGVRSEFPEFTEKAAVSLTIYENMKEGIKENPEPITTHLTMSPNIRVRERNRRMRKIGRGQ